MRSIVTGCLLLLAGIAEARTRAVRPRATLIPEPAACAMTPLAQEICNDGGTPAASLSATEVDAVVRAAARSLSDDTMVIAVVDRAGRPLALYRKPSAPTTLD
ncbi:MAG: hypothetical protein ACLGH0_09770, partial [Thermoanaerobaculia bacterium]